LSFKARAKHDMTNTVVAGCVTGGTLSAKGNFFIHHLRPFLLDTHTHTSILTCELLLDKI